MPQLKKQKTSESKFMVNFAEICTFFGCDRSTISRWIEKGFPKLNRGMYDLKQCFDWWRENINIGRDDDQIKAAKRRYWLASAEAKEIETARAKGEVIEWERVFAEWCRRASEARQGWLSMPLKLAPLLEMKSQAEVQEILRQEILRILDNYVRNGRWTPSESHSKKAKSGRRPSGARPKK